MPLFQLPQLITQLVNARVAMTRLQEFLSAPQQPPSRALPPAEPGWVLIHRMLSHALSCCHAVPCSEEYPR
jgi:ABC-type bacteriocin/lantibiotic exporter with double-glycine peptidase domain